MFGCESLGAMVGVSVGAAVVGCDSVASVAVVAAVVGAASVAVVSALAGSELVSVACVVSALAAIRASCARRLQLPYGTDGVAFEAGVLVAGGVALEPVLPLVLAVGAGGVEVEVAGGALGLGGGVGGAVITGAGIGGGGGAGLTTTGALATAWASAFAAPDPGRLPGRAARCGGGATEYELVMTGTWRRTSTRRTVPVWAVRTWRVVTRCTYRVLATPV